MRRIVEIKNFDELEQELNRLEDAQKIETSGVWSFYQILLHISDSIHFSIYGYPGLMPWLIRKTIGRLVLVKILHEGKMNPGAFNPYAPKKREEGDFQSVLRRLRECILEFKTFNGEFATHPIFDKMDKQTWEKLHCIHFSLHLSFVHPIQKEKVHIDPVVDINLKTMESDSVPPKEIKTIKGKKKKSPPIVKKKPETKKKTLSKKKQPKGKQKTKKK